MLSLREKNERRPKEMAQIKIPMKGEIKSRAKILTDEAFRKNRNYFASNEFGNDKNNKFFNDFNLKIAERQESFNKKEDIEQNVLYTAELRELLNKISADNFEVYVEKMLGYPFDETLLLNFKNLLYAKAVNESNFIDLYVKIIFSFFKKFKDSKNKKMNFKTLVLRTCQVEFEDNSVTSIDFPFHMDEEERSFRLKDGKIGNMRLICEFYIRKAVPLKILKSCWEVLRKEVNDLNVRILITLVKKVHKKLYFEDINLLHEMYNFCVKVREDKNANVETKTRFEVLDLIDLKKSDWGIKDEDQYLKAEIKEPVLNYSRKGSIARKRSSVGRKSSISVADIEKMKRGRFSSRADELDNKIEESDEIVESLMKDLETDLSFYSYFKLTEEEESEVKTPLRQKMHAPVEESLVAFKESTENDYEKFIVVGNYLEEMFEANMKGAEYIQKVLLFLLKEGQMTAKDMQHGFIRK